MTADARETVLIVEDEAFLRRVMAYLLEQQGFRVVQAEDGAAGLAVYAEHRDEVGLVLLDLDMPVMDGETMLRELRAAGHEVKAIVVSACCHPDQLDRVLTLGDVQYLPKPYGKDQLLELVKTSFSLS